MQEKLAVVCKFGLGDEFMMDDFFGQIDLDVPPPPY